MNPIEEQIESVVDSILEDYRNGRDIDKLDPFQQPDKAVVIDMIGKLMRILYPGAAREKTYRIYNARHNLSMLIEDVMYNLNKQIAIVLRSHMPQKEAEEKAQQVSLEFFRAIPKVRAMAQTDVQAFLTEIRRPSALTRSFSAIRDCLPSPSTGWPMCCISRGFRCCPGL